jgi:hypothetical protein
MFYIYERSSTYIMGGINKWDGTVRPDHRKSYKTMGASSTYTHEQTPPSGHVGECKRSAV